MPAMLARAAAVWFGLMLIAVANGALRIAFIIPLTGEATGHIVSSLLLCVFIVAIAALTVRWIGAITAGSLFAAGGLWLGMTVGFEFLFGHYVRGHSWETLLANYNVLAGRIWILVLVTTFFAPRLGMKLRGELGKE